MNATLTVLDEPELEFGRRQRHIDPRYGLAHFGPADAGQPTAPTGLRIGIVGRERQIEELEGWLTRCSAGVPARESNYPALFTAFPGFGTTSPFETELILDPRLRRAIPERDIERAAAETGPNAVYAMVQLYEAAIQAVVEVGRADVVICCRPDDLDDTGSHSKPNRSGLNFHDVLKARSMRLGTPLQLIRSGTWTGKGGQSLQDEATRAWNLFVALHYKGYGTPWRLPRSATDLSTLFIGVSFFEAFDKETLQTAVAQVFNERGDGMIVRGGKARIAKEDRQAHMTKEDSSALLSTALQRYRDEHQTIPARVVVHKTSDFTDAERRGLNAAADEERLSALELVWFPRGTPVRVFTSGSLAPSRGTCLRLDSQTISLYTHGTVPFYGLYPGMYTPRPLHLRVVQGSRSPITIAGEVLALTKMNWNQTQMGERLPITLRTASQVRSILRHIPAELPIVDRYAYYM